MTDRRSALVRVPTEEDRRSAFAARIAEALVARGEGAAALFETGPEGRATHAFLFPKDLLGPLPPPRAPNSLRRCGAVGLGIRFDLVQDLRPDPVRPPTVRPLVSTGALLATGATVRIRTAWLPGRGDGRLWVAREAIVRYPSGAAGRPATETLARALAQEWAARVGRPVRARRPHRPGTVGGIEELLRRPARAGWFPLAPPRAVATVEPILSPPGGGTLWAGGHVGVFGATGAGKTWFLAERAAQAVRDGAGVFAVDLHGDLGPALASRLPPLERDRLVAVDVEDRPVIGVAALAGSDDRAAGHLVAAVKRLTPDGSELYWGFRLERIFDAFVRLVLDSGGTLVDLYALLTDSDRREEARLATRRPELARFLDELGPIVRRAPEFLWPAAARLSKVALVPALAELLAPSDGGIDLERLLEDGRAVVVRLPFGRLGAEAASLAGSLLVARAYYGLVARRSHGAGRPVVAVLDEVHGLSPRLVTEMLTEGRKFGVRLLLASQYPDRLAPELRAAVAGTVRDLVVFRTPTAAVPSVAAWLGLGPADAASVVGELPTGTGVARTPAGELVGLSPPERSAPLSSDWSEAARRSREEFGPIEERETSEGGAAERVLLAVFAAEEEGRPLAPEELPAAAAELAGGPADPVELGVRALELERHGLLERSRGALVLTPAGTRRLGLRTSTGATRESDEHRALLVRTFRLFARRGYRLEIVRQGRYDTTLPDGRLRQLGESGRLGPRELALALRQAEGGWAWRFFGGRDVHVEAEVSGALRAERIRRGVRKALARGAFPLFVVPDPARAARVRRTLRALGLGPREAQVWTLTEPRPGATVAPVRERTDAPTPTTNVTS